MADSDSDSTTPAPEASSSFGRGVLVAASFCVLVLAAFTAYYYLSIRERRSLIDQVHLRLLSDAASNISETLRGLEKNVEKAFSFEPKEIASLGADGVKRQVQGRLDQIHGTKIAILGETRPEEILTRLDGAVKVWTRSIESSGGDQHILFELGPGPPPEPGPDEVASDRPPTFLVSATISGRVKELLPELFDGAFLFRSDGEVLVARTGPDLRISNFSTILRNQGAEDGEEGNGGPAPTTSHTRIGNLTIGDVHYRLFSQPLEVPLALEGDLRWTVAGVSRGSRLERETLIISPTLVLSVLTFLVLGLLSLPYVRVCSLGPAERLRGHEVGILVVCFLLSTSIATVALLDFFGYRQMIDSVEARLQSVSQEIVQKVDDELARLDRALVEILGTGQAFEPGQGQAELLETNLPGLSGYPFLELLFVMDKNGLQAAKLSAQESFTALTKLSHREYFKRARDRQFWESTLLESSGRPSVGSETVEPGYYVESIRSVTTGSVFAMLSKRLRPGFGNGSYGEKRTLTVAAIESALLSTIDPVLPPGLQFAVIDGEGKVLFHSDKSRNLKEDFFREIDSDGNQIRAAVQDRIATTVSAVYRTVPTKLFVRPMGRLPWTLVVLADKNPVWARHLEVLWFVFALLGTYFLLVLGLMVWHRVSSLRGMQGLDEEDKWTHWYWPRKASAGDYSCLLGFQALILVCWMALFIIASPEQRLSLAVVVPLLLLAGVFMKLGNGKDRPVQLGWLVCGVLSSLGFAALVWGRTEETSTWIALPLGLLFVGLVLAARNAAILYLWLGILAIALSCKPGASPGLELIPLVGLVLGGGLLMRSPNHGLLRLLEISWITSKIPARLRHPLSEKSWRGAYVLSTVGLVFILGAIPALTAYRVVFDEVAVVSAKHDHLQFASALARRADRIVDRFKNVPTTLEITRKLESELLPSDPDPRGFPITNCPDVMGGNPWERYHPGTCLEHGSTDRRRGQPLTAYEYTRHPALPGHWVKAQQPVLRFLDLRGKNMSPSDLFSLSRHSYAIRNLSKGADLFRDGVWDCPIDEKEKEKMPPRFSWLHPPGDDPVLHFHVTEYRRNDRLGRPSEDGPPPAGTPVDLCISSPIEKLSFRESRLLVGFLLFVGALWFVARSISRRVFLLYVKLPEPCSLGSVFGRARLRLELRSRSNVAAGITIGAAEVRAASSIPDLIEKARMSPGSTITLLDFEDGLDEPLLIARKLELLESLPGATDKKIVIRSEIDPLYFLTHFAQDPLAGAEEHVSLERWAAALEPFRLVRGDRGARDRRGIIQRLTEEYRERARKKLGDDRGEAVWATLAEECWGTEYLEKLGRSLAGNAELAAHETYRVVEQVYDLAEPHFRHLWASCSRQEKLLLYRLSQDGFVNWQMKDTLKRLLRRGFVAEARGFELMSRGFAVFVLRAESPGTILRWEVAAGPGVWSRLRLPLFLLLVLVGGFLFFTQRERFQQIVGLMTAIAAGAPTLFKVVGFARSQQQ